MYAEATSPMLSKIYFSSLILLGTFLTLNLITAVIYYRFYTRQENEYRKLSGIEEKRTKIPKKKLTTT